MHAPLHRLQRQPLVIAAIYHLQGPVAFETLCKYKLNYCLSVSCKQLHVIEVTVLAQLALFADYRQYTLTVALLRYISLGGFAT